jgi:hypothetical protein
MKPGIFITFFAFLLLLVAPARSQDNWPHLSGGGLADTGIHKFESHTSSNTHTSNSRQTNPSNQGGSSSPSRPVAAQQEDFDAEFQALYLKADSKQAMQEWWDLAKKSGNPAAWFNYAALASRLDDYNTAAKTYEWLTTHCGTDTRVCSLAKERLDIARQAAFEASLAESQCNTAKYHRLKRSQFQQEQTKLFAQKHDLDLQFETLAQKTNQLHQKTTEYNTQKSKWEMDPSSAGKANLQDRWNELVALQKTVTDGTVKWAVDNKRLTYDINQNDFYLNQEIGYVIEFSQEGACAK